MEFKIKTFNELNNKELYKILKLRASVFVVEQEIVYNDLDDLDFDCYHAFIENNNEIVAYLRIFNKGINFDNISFGRVVTSNLHRKEGLGKTLIENSIEFVHDVMKENTIRLQSQISAVKFYEKIGFVQEGNEYMKEGILHMNMVYEKKVH